VEQVKLSRGYPSKPHRTGDVTWDDAVGRDASVPPGKVAISAFASGLPAFLPIDKHRACQRRHFREATGATRQLGHNGKAVAADVPAARAPGCCCGAASRLDRCRAGDRTGFPRPRRADLAQRLRGAAQLAATGPLQLPMKTFTLAPP